jgi:hypothetical protein
MTASIIGMVFPFSGLCIDPCDANAPRCRQVPALAATLGGKWYTRLVYRYWLAEMYVHADVEAQALIPLQSHPTGRSDRTETRV